MKRGGDKNKTLVKCAHCGTKLNAVFRVCSCYKMLCPVCIGKDKHGCELTPDAHEGVPPVNPRISSPNPALISAACPVSSSRMIPSGSSTSLEK